MEEILSISQAAKLCAVAASTVQYWENKGYISSFKTIGGHRRFKRSDIVSFMKLQGRDLSAEAKKAETAVPPTVERRCEQRFRVNYDAKVEFFNPETAHRYICMGRIVDLSDKGMGLLLCNLDLKTNIVISILEQYQKIQVWPQGSIGYLRTPIRGEKIDIAIQNNDIRMGLKFITEEPL